MKPRINLRSRSVISKEVYFCPASQIRRLFRTNSTPQDALEALWNYIEFSGCSYVFCVPLISRGSPIGHLTLEYFTAIPNQVEIITMLNVAPFISAALVEKWLFSKRPELSELIDPDIQG